MNGSENVYFEESAYRSNDDEFIIFGRKDGFKPSPCRDKEEELRCLFAAQWKVFGRIV